MSDEFSRIARFFAPLAGPEGRGLADDAAVLAPPPGRELVLTVDQMHEEVHFLPQDPPDLIARKLLRRNLSDLAAMGAVPLGYLLTTALNADVDDLWLEKFAGGLAEDQKRYGIALFGGDSSSSRGKNAFTATLIGHVAPGAALGRGGARPGDGVWVTGVIGDAAIGLRARYGEFQDSSGYFTQRSLLPEPRLGLDLAGIAHAAIDISDGLLQDLQHICAASGVAASIQAPLVPISAAAAGLEIDTLEWRLTGGDDYELLLAVPPEQEGLLRAACGTVPVTKIGNFVDGAGVSLIGRNGRPLHFARPGWRHFS